MANYTVRLKNEIIPTNSDALYSLIYWSVIAWGQDELPTDSAELISKLDTFAKAEREKVEELIAAKSNEVAEVLKSHLERETKRGNLKSALAIQTVIDGLKADSPDPKKGQNQPSTDKPNSKFADATWSYGGPSEWTFNQDGTGTKMFNEQPVPFTWKEADDNLIVIELKSGRTEHFIFGPRRDDGWTAAEAGSKSMQLQRKP